MFYFILHKTILIEIGAQRTSLQNILPPNQLEVIMPRVLQPGGLSREVEGVVRGRGGWEGFC